MKRVIWKFPLAPVEEQQVTMPRNAVPLCVGMQMGTMCLWCLVDSSEPPSQRRVFVLATGFSATTLDKADYVGTIHDNIPWDPSWLPSQQVWHIFVAPEGQ